MANIEQLDFKEKTWHNRDLFPSIEPSEEKAREDMQRLFNVIRDYINHQLIPGVTNVSEIENLHFDAETGVLTVMQNGVEHTVTLPQSEAPSGGSGNTSGSTPVSGDFVESVSYNQTARKLTVRKNGTNAEYFLGDIVSAVSYNPESGKLLVTQNGSVGSHDMPFVSDVAVSGNTMTVKKAGTTSTFTLPTDSTSGGTSSNSVVVSDCTCAAAENESGFKAASINNNVVNCYRAGPVVHFSAEIDFDCLGEVEAVAFLIGTEAGKPVTPVHSDAEVRRVMANGQTPLEQRVYRATLEPSETGTTGIWLSINNCNGMKFSADERYHISVGCTYITQKS